MPVVEFLSTTSWRPKISGSAALIQVDGLVRYRRALVLAWAGSVGNEKSMMFSPVNRIEYNEP